MTCTDPSYHDHTCEGYSLERIADLLERLADTLAPTPEQAAIRAEDEAFARAKAALPAPDPQLVGTEYGRWTR